MHNKPLRDSQKKVALEKMIKSNALSTENKLIIELLKFKLSDVLTRWMAGVDKEDAEGFRCEAACLRDLIQILSNAPLELVQGDK